jgi:hypothetical protein
VSRHAGAVRKKLAGVVPPGEVLVAAGEFQYPFASGRPNPEIAAYHELHGRDPRADLSFARHAGYGYVGVTESRLILAKSPLFLGVKRKHVFVDDPREECELAWYDKKLRGGAEHRIVHLSLPDGRFASFAMLTGGLGVLSSAREAWQAAARDLVDAFGDRAHEITPPPAR